jgi:membrane protease YdiL (CAAX protease family)
MKRNMSDSGLSLWKILAALFCAKLFSLLGLFFLKGSTELGTGLIIFLARMVELFIFLWLVSSAYKPIHIWLKDIINRHEPYSSQHKILKTILFVFILSAMARYFIEVIMIALASIFDPKAIDEIQSGSGKPGFSTFSQIFIQGKTLSQISIAPLVEEVIYRGVILNYLLRRHKALLALIISSLIFSVLHGNPLAAFLGGLMFGGIYLYTGRLIYCIIAHATANFVILLLYIFPEKVFTFFSAVATNPASNAVAILAATTWLLVFGIYYLRNSWQNLDSPFDMKFDENKGQ